MPAQASGTANEALPRGRGHAWGLDDGRDQ
jgi:hypothetical protein